MVSMVRQWYQIALSNDDIFMIVIPSTMYLMVIPTLSCEGVGLWVHIAGGVEERIDEAKGQVRQILWKAGRRGGGLVEQVREGCVERFGIVPNSIHSRSERWKAFTVGCCSGCWKL